MAAPSFMLRRVSPDGSLAQFLPDYASIDMSPVFSGIGTVRFDYPANGKNAALIDNDVEIAVVMNGTEIGGLRCIIESSEGDDASEAGDGTIWTYTARTMLALLDRAVVYPKNWPVSSPATHDFVNATAGKILRDLVLKAQGRGALLGITLGFTNTTDSNGQPWPTGYDLSFDAGVTYSEAVQTMVDGLMVEVDINSRNFLAYIPNGLGVDRSTGSTPLRFLKGRDLRESPRKSSTRELGTVVLAAGDNNAYAEQSSSPATLSQWGRREWYFSASGLTNTTAVSYVATKVLDTRNRPLLEVTHGLHFEADENPRPIRDFRVGDWALSNVGYGWEKYRIKQWVMTVSSSGEVTGSVTLNDLIAEQLEKLNKKISLISGGLSGTGSSEEKDDGKAPGKTSNVTLGTDYYIGSSNVARAIITVSWVPITTNADGTPLNDLAEYRVRWKYTGDSTWRATISLDSDETNTMISPVDTGRQVQVQVGAIDKWGHGGGYTASNFITTAVDTIAPAKPASPVVTSNVGTLRITWTGLDYQGQQMAPDFAGVEVHLGTSPSFTPSGSTQRDYLTARSNTATTITGLTYGTEYWAKLIAVDRAGNKSPVSDTTSTSHIVLTPVVNVEIGTGQIGLGNIRFSDVGNLVDDGSFENADVRAARTALMSATHMAFDNSTASNSLWSLKIGPVAVSTTESTILQSGLPTKPGERFFGAADFRVSSSASAAAAVQIFLWFYDKNGVILDPITGAPGTTATAHATLASSFGTAHDDGWHPRITGTSKQSPPNAASVDVGVRVFSLYTGNVWMDALEIRRQVDTLMVADAAIGRAQIADLAVNNAKIADLSVGKLTTGTLAADIVVGARIKTADYGARAEMNSGGFGLWNNLEVQTLFASSTTGEVRIKGQLVSEFSGRRIEVNPTSTQLPEIRFYPTSGSNYAYLNAADGASGNEVSIGLNSGSFSGNSGVLSQYRLYMTNASQGAHLQTVETSTQALNGGYLRIDTSRATLGVNASGRNHGFVETFHESASTLGARIGHDGSTNSTDCWTEYRDNGQITTIGRFEDGFGPSANQALHMYTMDLASSVSGVIWTWGVTMLTRLFPLTQVRDQGAHAGGLINTSTTGFEINYDVATTGGSSLHFLSYRGS